MKTRRSLLVVTLLFASALALFGMGLLPVHSSANITVNGPGDVIAADGICILREAVINANQDDLSGSADCAPGSGADTIGFNLPGGTVISVTDQSSADEIVISDALTILGPGTAELAISQDDTHTRRLFHVTAGVSLTITDITLRDIHALSTGQYGAVIYNEGGNVTIRRVHFINNRTGNTDGAIFSELGGLLTVEESEFHGNIVLSSNGGAIQLDSDAVIRNSLFYSNTSSNTGGAIGISGDITVTIENNVFQENQTGNDGAAVAVGGGDPHVHISHTTFQDNICDDCEGGAIDNHGILTIVNSTFSGNLGRLGGAIYSETGTSTEYATTIIHSTFVGNSSTGGPTSGGALYIRKAGASALLNFRMHGSIVANNSGGSDCDVQESGSAQVISLGYNMVESGCGTIFNEPTDLPGVDPMVGSLQNNGGLGAPLLPPYTHALLAGSQAIDLGNCNSSSVMVDQRYAARPVNTNCDAGAYEFGGTPPTPTATPTATPSPTSTPPAPFDDSSYLPFIMSE